MSPQNPSSPPPFFYVRKWLRRALWKIAGAEPAVLEKSPRRDQTKFIILGTVNLALAAAVGWMTFEWRSRATSTTVSTDAVIALLAFIVALAMLGIGGRISEMRHLAPAVRGGAILVFQAPFIVAVGLLLWALANSVSQIEFYLEAAFCAWTFLSSTYLRLVWKSPDYDLLLEWLQESSRDGPAAQSPRGPDVETVAATIEEGANAKEIEIEAQLQAAFERSPDNEIGLQLIEVRKRLRKYPEAAEVFDTLLSLEPRNIQLIEGKANLYREMGNDRSYRKTLERADELREDVAFEQNLGKTITVVSLEMRDLEFFGAFKWEFQPQVSVLLGRNGYGKSFMLKALVATLQKEKQLTDKFFENSRSSPFMRVDITREGSPASTIRSREFFEEPSFGKMPVLAIPDTRYVNKGSDTIGLASDTAGMTGDERTNLCSQSAWHFLRDQPYDGVIMKLLYGMCLDYYADRKLGFDGPLFKLMEESVFKLTGSPFKFQEIRRREHEFEISVLTEGNERPLSLQKASQGTLSVLAMVGLIYRYLRAINEKVPEKELTAQRAIVIIDEIDAHLHPIWQQKILELFRSTFPNVQFIITAHSPLVIAGCKKYEVAVLRKEPDGFRVDVLPDHFIGATADKMYRDVFKVEETDATYSRLNTLSKPELEEKAAKLEQVSGRSAAQESELDELKQDIFYLHQFEEVKAERRKAERFQTERRSLELERNQLRGEVSSMKKELSRYQGPEADARWQSVIEKTKGLGQLDETQRSWLEAAAQALAETGRLKESVQILEVLRQADPSNLERVKILAVNYQTLGQFADAAKVVEEALRLAPEDKELAEAASRLGPMAAR